MDLANCHSLPALENLMCTVLGVHELAEVSTRQCGRCGCGEFKGGVRGGRVPHSGCGKRVGIRAKECGVGYRGGVVSGMWRCACSSRT